MRKALVALTLTAFSLGAFATIDTASAAPAKMTKMGCMVGKQKYDAAMGKCVEAKPVKKAMKSSMKKPVMKKAM